MGANYREFILWPLERIVNVWFCPYNVPVGRLVFPDCNAALTSSSPIWREASRLGSSWARSAYFWEPYTCTWATPFTIETFWAMVVSAASSTSDSFIVGEL